MSRPREVEEGASIRELLQRMWYRHEVKRVPRGPVLADTGPVARREIEILLEEVTDDEPDPARG